MEAKDRLVEILREYDCHSKRRAAQAILDIIPELVEVDEEKIHNLTCCTLSLAKKIKAIKPIRVCGDTMASYKKTRHNKHKHGRAVAKR